MVPGTGRPCDVVAPSPAHGQAFFGVEEEMGVKQDACNIPVSYTHLAIHGPRINEREKKSSGRSKAQAPPQPAQDSASRKPPEQPVPPAQPPQSVQPARQVGFASVFGREPGAVVLRRGQQ